ncbi:FOP N terminal dimerization domain [Trypanosoma vivax]|uniref:FGFR1 oncogene partner (FOP) N-terminal dimerisation domain-containing protein n=1 Tax=Trypanosoma vivax (strain Y486) TaxID=1055687 RepID=G0UAJ7_TRYVY|nr:hypothetical protein TRVL_05784 [Trypanosoma vivax]KAH8617997.1 FOP N terminal dimerization domain [Trypanosoma vivax]CCC52830.1 conserved hypothetical protein [Trypanosoma vivax Y486]
MDEPGEHPVAPATGVPRQEALKDAMREIMETKGVINHVKAELRAAIFHSLQEVSSLDGGTQSSRPPQPPENLLLNELIKDYMTFNGMEHSLAVFQAESGTAKAASGSAVPRTVLAAQMGLTGAPSSVPLLYAMLHELRISKDG